VHEKQLEREREKKVAAEFRRLAEDAAELAKVLIIARVACIFIYITWITWIA
jgi:hypothetical protein